jgi:hypothetical protein
MILLREPQTPAARLTMWKGVAMNRPGTTTALASAGLAAAALLVTACGNQTVTAGNGKPPLLHLSSQSTPREAAMGVAAPTGAPQGQDGYVLAGSLPTEHPADQPVYRLAPATKTQAEHIATALNLHGTPTRIDGGWVLRAPNTMRLLVNDGGSWSFAMDCFADQPIDKESAEVMCASASGGGVAVASPGVVTAAPAPSQSGSSGSGPATSPKPPATPVPPPVVTPPPTPPPGPTTQQAKRDAQSILTALGLADATISSQQGSPTTYVTADPMLDAKPTQGWTTSLEFDTGDQLVSGNGWITNATKGDSYPVITAQAAFELLKKTPVVYPLLCMVRKDGKSGCEQPAPRKVTGATLGLVMDQDQHGAILVPAWLFTIDGQSQPVAQVAIDPSYLAPPPTPTPLPGGPVNSTSPEIVPPAPPGSESPATPK